MTCQLSDKKFPKNNQEIIQPIISNNSQIISNNVGIICQIFEIISSNLAQTISKKSDLVSMTRALEFFSSTDEAFFLPQN